MIVNPIDYKFMQDTPDLGFSAERNKEVVEASIKKYEAMRRKKLQQASEGMAERVDAIATYLTSMKGSNMPAWKYFGRRWMAYLRGDELRKKMMGNTIQADINEMARKLKSER
jgi:hypothetical protein